MCPQKQKIGGELPTLATRPRVGPKPLANPKPTRVGKGGGGGEAPSQGVWGMCPQKFKRGRVANPGNPATSGTQNAGEPQAHEGGQMGGPGGKAPWRGAAGGVTPENFGTHPAYAIIRCATLNLRRKPWLKKWSS